MFYSIMYYATEMLSKIFSRPLATVLFRNPTRLLSTTKKQFVIENKNAKNGQLSRSLQEEEGKVCANDLTSSDKGTQRNTFRFPGEKLAATTEMKFLDPVDNPRIPVYRVLSKSGDILPNAMDPNLDNSTLLTLYHNMVKLNIMDTALNEAENEGLISLYITNQGEEAAQIGSASALDRKDLIFGQYREAGVLLWRGNAVENFVNQCFCNSKDLNKGRQMPVHYGSKELNFVTISTPVGTQLPQAAGSAYTLKMNKSKNCVVCYFGEGTASEGDAHAAFNFAAVLKCPVIFFCRNNGYAISTPVTQQYCGDGIASRGAGYGIPTIRVNGNDILAVYNATKAARKMCVEQSRPVLIEAMTYRIGEHSTLYDAIEYRKQDEVEFWNQTYNPITRFRNYLVKRNLLIENQEAEFKEKVSAEVREAIKRGAEMKYCRPEEMFTDVYDVMPKHLAKQQKAMLEHVNKYKEEYPLSQFLGTKR